MTKPKAVLVDLDNTLALIGDRDPMHGHLCHTDTLCEATALVLNALTHVEGLRFVILTGRNETAREATATWLADRIYFDRLIMRDPSDWRPAAEYKTAMLDEKVLPYFDVILALDDDPDVIAAYRERGLVAWQVREPLPESAGAGRE